MKKTLLLTFFLFTTIINFSYAKSNERQRFNKEMIGHWEAIEFLNGAWVKLTWEINRRSARHLVVAYADSQMTLPILEWDITRKYKLKKKSSQFPDAYNLRWKDQKATLEVFMDNPELFSQLGIDDCQPKVGVKTDLSINNCAAPLFPFRKCRMFDFAELSNNNEFLTFGDPGQNDRCIIRPTKYEGWSFSRL